MLHRAAACRHPNAGYAEQLQCRVCPDCSAVLPGRGNKYHAVATEVDGIRFDSQAEARRYLVLRDRERAGEIRGLTVHPQFSLDVMGVHISLFTLDFGYRETDSGRLVWEDVKGGRATMTEAYRLRKKLLRAIHGMTVTEVQA